MTEAVSVYVFGAGDGLVKVGVSGDTKARAAQLRAMLPGGRMIYERPVDAARVRKAERLAHDMLAAHRVNGEWFAVDADAAIMAVDGAADAAVPPPSKVARSRPASPMTWPRVGRIVMDWTLKDLSDKSGISRFTIARLEAGDDSVTCGTVDRVLRAFFDAGVTMTQTIPGIISRGLVMHSPPGSRIPAEWPFCLSYASGTARAKPKRASRLKDKGGE